jgi:hypothetical protein
MLPHFEAIHKNTLQNTMSSASLPARFGSSPYILGNFIIQEYQWLYTNIGGDTSLIISKFRNHQLQMSQNNSKKLINRVYKIMCMG